MGTTSSGKANELPFAERYRVRDSITSLTILSRASCVFTCFLANFKDTKVSGIDLSCRVLGFELKNPMLEDSRGYRMY